MATRSLPLHPSLAQLKLQANELRRACREGSRAAASRVVAHHPLLKGRPLESVFEKPLALADAQRVLAREYGFDHWALLKHHVEVAGRVAEFKPHPRFDDAVAALDAGDLDRLRSLLASDPALFAPVPISSHRSITSPARHCCITSQGIPTGAGSLASLGRSRRTSSKSHG